MNFNVVEISSFGKIQFKFYSIVTLGNFEELNSGIYNFVCIYSPSFQKLNLWYFHSLFYSFQTLFYSNFVHKVLESVNLIPFFILIFF